MPEAGNDSHCKCTASALTSGLSESHQGIRGVVFRVWLYQLIWSFWLVCCFALGQMKTPVSKEHVKHGQLGSQERKDHREMLTHLCTLPWACSASRVRCAACGRPPAVETSTLAWVPNLWFCFHASRQPVCPAVLTSQGEKLRSWAPQSLGNILDSECELMWVSSETLIPSASTNNIEFLGLPDWELNLVRQGPHQITNTLRPWQSWQLTVPDTAGFSVTFFIRNDTFICNDWVKDYTSVPGLS